MTRPAEPTITLAELADKQARMDTLVIEIMAREAELSQLRCEVQAEVAAVREYMQQRRLQGSAELISEPDEATIEAVAA